MIPPLFDNSSGFFTWTVTVAPRARVPRSDILCFILSSGSQPLRSMPRSARSPVRASSRRRQMPPQSTPSRWAGLKWAAAAGRSQACRRWREDLPGRDQADGRARRPCAKPTTGTSGTHPPTGPERLPPAPACNCEFSHSASSSLDPRCGRSRLDQPPPPTGGSSVQTVARRISGLARAPAPRRGSHPRRLGHYLPRSGGTRTRGVDAWGRSGLTSPCRSRPMQRFQRITVSDFARLVGSFD